MTSNYPTSLERDISRHVNDTFSTQSAMLTDRYSTILKPHQLGAIMIAAFLSHLIGLAKAMDLTLTDMQEHVANGYKAYDEKERT
jgi:hypothetical protein